MHQSFFIWNPAIRIQSSLATKRPRISCSQDVIGLDDLDLQTEASFSVFATCSWVWLAGIEVFSYFPGLELNGHQVRKLQNSTYDRNQGTFLYWCLQLPRWSNHWDADLQNAYYNGWKSQCFSSWILVWDCDGCVIYAFWNTSGSWQDSRIAEDLYLKLLDLSQGWLLCDYAFPNTGNFFQKFCCR